MIRESPTIESVTITDITPAAEAVLARVPYQEAAFPTSVLLFYRYQGRYYYPLSLEFRLIDNNLLFLLVELEVADTETLKHLLTAAMLKEEQWASEFKIALTHLTRAPRHMHLLPPHFTIPQADYEFHE